MSRRRRVELACVLLGGLALAWQGLRALDARRLRAELAEAERDMDAQRFGTAGARLARLEARWPGEAHVEYLRGLCALARGRRDEALAAWARVPPGTPFSARAAALRGTHLINSGRYAPAEEALEAVRRDRGAGADEVAVALDRLYRFEGRADDVRRVLDQTWGLATNPAAALKEHWLLDKSPWPVEAWKAALDKADPDDDRVWLGYANLAIRTGQFDEARRRLDACARRRPDDPAVWRARLDLALASDDPAGVWEAAPRLAADRLSKEDALALRAWLAARLGDPDAERRALHRLVEHAPGRSSAWERLAVLAHAEGQSVLAANLRRKKAEIDDAQDRCRKILLDNADLVARAGELARLTAELGRRAESKGWSLLEARGAWEPGPIGRDLAPLDPPSSRAPGRTVADLVADLRPAQSPARPGIKAGADGAAPDFVDDAEAAGLAKFTFDNGQTSQRQLAETMSGGVALLDFDGDGRLDVYAVQGGPIDPRATATSTEGRDGDRLFRNRGDGTFEDVTEKSRIAALPRGYGLGVTVGDYDNDGRPDLFVSRPRSYALYRNRGDGTFEDATEAAGLAGPRDNPTSAAFADLDNDGDLDLYVCHYMIDDPDHPTLCINDQKGEYFYCDPHKVVPAPDHVFRNDGGKFTDVTARAGFVDPGGRGLGVVAADVDGDNRVDLFVANDGTANYLFRNLGGFKFEETGHASGVAGNAEGGYQAGMGVAAADLDGDGRPELLVTNFYGEGTTLYRNLGQGLFADHSAASGLAVATRYLLGFGIAPLDFDNDGRIDIFQVNGHVNDNRPYYLHAMPAKLFRGDGKGRLTDVSDRAGAPWKTLRVGRGLAVGDLDNDGRTDAVVLAQNEPLAYFHNRTRAGHWLAFRLEGTKSNRDGVGARVTVVVVGSSQVQQRVGGGSYQSASDPRLHFGLGAATRAESVEVRWPSGKIDRFQNLGADAGCLLREGDGEAKPLAGYGR